MMEERKKFVLERLNKIGIEYELIEHEPLPTIEIALEFWKNIDSTHCKNLFFRNHKGNKHYLVILECHKEMDIHGLEKQLHQGKLSFASPERMMKYLGTTPGSVSLFGLLNDPNRLVKLYIDKDLFDAHHLTFHPNDNTASLKIANSDMRRFIEEWGGEWETI
jgi:Ala-tRNA(Pro) deacylase